MIKKIKKAFDWLTAISLIGMIVALSTNHIKSAIVCTALMSIFQVSSVSVQVQISEPVKPTFDLEGKRMP